MDSIRIASTDLLGLRPLGTSGDRNHARLRDTLENRLGEDYALLLAEPVPKPDGSRVDWYLPGTQRVVPLAKLSEEDRNRVEQTLAGMRDAVLRLAETLERDGRSGVALASGLRHAMVVPGPEHVYAVPVPGPEGGHRPVLVAWAHAHEQGELDYIGRLQAYVPTPRRAAAAVDKPAPLAASGDGAAIAPAGGAALAMAPAAPASGAMPFLLALLWLLLAFLVAAILWLLLRGCGFGIVPLTILDWCRTPVAITRDLPRDDTAALIDLVRNLEGQVAARDQECRVREAAFPPTRFAPVPPISEPIVEPGPADEPAPRELSREAEEAQQRVREAGGREGALQFTLIWEGRPDLDLSVQCPSGETINFSRRNGCQGGTLDVDRNVGGGNPGEQPVEHISWPENAAPASGRYVATVNNFGSHGDRRSQIPYRLIIRDGDRPPVEIEGQVGRSTGSGRSADHVYDR